MGSQDAAVARQVDRLRRDGSLVARFKSGEEAAAWRAAIRRACRADGLRIRTGLATGGRNVDRVPQAILLDSREQRDRPMLTLNGEAHRLERR